MSSEFRMNPNWERELRREAERNLGPEMDREIAALARRLKGKDRDEIRRTLEAEGFSNIEEELIDAMKEGRAVPTKISWR
jgi:hypothetical protein